MDKAQLIDYMQQHFGVEPEYPWRQWSSYMVFRHKDNRKWFAIVMDVPSEKLGLQGSKMVDIVNLKADPDLIDDLVQNKGGFLPAYHMNKRLWVSILLNESVPAEDITPLVNASFDRTK